jgi:ABC-type branched-subunit amino acid transport system permease subunit
VRWWKFLIVALLVAAAVFLGARAINNDYYFFAGYTVLQFIVLATAWNILGGYTGYVNFGSAAFFALGVYTTIFFQKTFPLPIPVLVVLGGESHPALHRANMLLSAHLRHASLATVAGAAHFIPATHPQELAGLIARHVARAEAGPRTRTLHALPREMVRPCNDIAADDRDVPAVA